MPIETPYQFDPMSAAGVQRSGDVRVASAAAGAQANAALAAERERQRTQQQANTMQAALGQQALGMQGQQNQAENAYKQQELQAKASASNDDRALNERLANAGIELQRQIQENDHSFRQALADKDIAAQHEANVRAADNEAQQRKLSYFQTTVGAMAPVLAACAKANLNPNQVQENVARETQKLSEYKEKSDKALREGFIARSDPSLSATFGQSMENYLAALRLDKEIGVTNVSGSKALFAALDATSAPEHPFVKTSLLTEQEWRDYAPWAAGVEGAKTPPPGIAARIYWGTQFLAEHLEKQLGESQTIRGVYNSRYQSAKEGLETTSAATEKANKPPTFLGMNLSAPWKPEAWGYQSNEAKAAEEVRKGAQKTYEKAAGEYGDMTQYEQNLTTALAHINRHRGSLNARKLAVKDPNDPNAVLMFLGDPRLTPKDETYEDLMRRLGGPDLKTMRANLAKEIASTAADLGSVDSPFGQNMRAIHDIIKRMADSVGLDLGTGDAFSGVPSAEGPPPQQPQQPPWKWGDGSTL
jgi:hypothetical protein